MTPGRLRPAAVLALLAGPLLSMVDSNVVNVAIPDISRDLGAALTSVQWSVSGYLLALAATLPATSWLGKRFGTIRVYAVSLAAFTLASVACALAASVAELIAFRAVQGMTAAPLVPLAMNLLFGSGAAGRGDDGQRRIPAVAGLVLFLGPALGPTIGGLLIAAWSWPAIFLINLPIGVAALCAVPTLRRNGIVDHRDPDARFDPVGLALLSASLVLALDGTSRAPVRGWWSGTVWPLWASGLLLLIVYMLWARNRSHPAVDLRLLRRARSALAVWLCMVTSVALFSILFLLPLIIQDVQGHGPLAAGLVLLPQGVVMGLSTQAGQYLADRARLRLSILLGLGAVIVTTALLLLVGVNTPLWTTAVILAGRGLGLGLVIQPLLVAMLDGLAPAQLADANTLFNVGQRLGGSVGVSLLATFFTLRVSEHVSSVLGRVAAGRSGGAGLSGGFGTLADAPPALRRPLADAAFAGFHDTVWAAVGIAVLGLLFALALRSIPAPTSTEPAPVLVDAGPPR